MTKLEKALSDEALSHFELRSPQLEFIRHNENITSRVVTSDGVYVLRVHRPAEGFNLHIFGDAHDDAELIRGECALLLHMSERADFPVQVPVVTKDGYLRATLSDGTPACLLRWLDGEVVKADDANLPYLLGRLAASIHKATEGFTGARLCYSHELISAMKLELSSARDVLHIKAEEHDVCLSALDEIDAVMYELDSLPGSRGIVHADLGLSNIIMTPAGLAPIDFSLSGFGYSAAECGMLASNFSDGLRGEILRGYSDVSGMGFKNHHIDAFFALSILLFIVCQHNKCYMEEWFVKAMDRWCKSYFAPLSL